MHVDDYQAEPGSNHLYNLDIDANGSVLAIGEHIQGGLRMHFGRRSNDGGTTWSEDTAYKHAVSTQDGHPLRIVRDKLGNIFENGAYVATDGTVHGFVRKSVNNGGAWTISDDLLVIGTPATGPEITIFRGLHVGADNNLYNAGYYMNSANNYVPVIRKAGPGGTGWTTLPSPPITAATEPWDIDGDSAGSLYMAANEDVGTARHWVIYKSSNQGESWSIVNTFQYAASQPSLVQSLKVARNGEIFVSGLVYDVNSRPRTLVRRSSDRGTTWATSDDFLLPLAPDGNPFQPDYLSSWLSFDPTDQTMYVAGIGNIRKLSCN